MPTQTTPTIPHADFAGDDEESQPPSLPDTVACESDLEAQVEILPELVRGGPTQEVLTAEAASLPISPDALSTSEAAEA